MSVISEIKFPIEPTDGVIFEAPKNIEVARLISPTCLNGSGSETQLYIRLECPNLQKRRITPPEKRRPKLCGFPICGKSRSEKQVDPMASLQWSYLLQADDEHNGLTWFSIPTCQQPSNGQIWIRLMERRICLMVVICGSSIQVDNKSVNPSKQNSPATDSSLDFSDDELMNTLEHMFPITYYFWDSGQFQEEFNKTRSRINVANDSIYLTLAPARVGNNLAWSDQELQMLRTGNMGDQVQTPFLKLPEEERREQNNLNPGKKHDNHQSRNSAEKTQIKHVVEEILLPLSAEDLDVVEEPNVVIPAFPEELVYFNKDLVTWRNGSEDIIVPEAPKFESPQTPALQFPASSPSPPHASSCLKPEGATKPVATSKLSPKSRRIRACALVHKNMVAARSSKFTSTVSSKCMDPVALDAERPNEGQEIDDGVEKCENKPLPLPKSKTLSHRETDAAYPQIRILRTNSPVAPQPTQPLKSDDPTLNSVDNFSNVYRKSTKHEKRSTFRPLRANPSAEEGLSTDNLCSEDSRCFHDDRHDSDTQNKKISGKKKWYFWERSSNRKSIKVAKIPERHSHSRTTQSSIRFTNRYDQTPPLIRRRRSTSSECNKFRTHSNSERKTSRKAKKKAGYRERNESPQKRDKRLQPNQALMRNIILKEHSEELVGMQLIQSQLENITDEQWNRVIDILACHGDLRNSSILLNSSSQVKQKSCSRKKRQVSESITEICSDPTTVEEVVVSKPTTDVFVKTETPESRKQLLCQKREQLRMRQAHANFSFSSHKGRATYIMKHVL